MPPKQVVDLDLDAISPPNRTVKLHGKVWELPGDMPIESVVRAMSLQGQMETGDDQAQVNAINELLEIIHDLFRECNPDYEPVQLSLANVMHILGLVLSGMEIDFETAVKEALVGLESEEDEQPEDREDHPPTSRAGKPEEKAAPRSRSRKPSLARS